MAHRFLLKVNGELHCPQGICRPQNSNDWQGGEVLIDQDGPIILEDGKRYSAPEIEPGDELWIWAHEHESHGRGRGLTARAIAGPSRSIGSHQAIALTEVELLARPFGFRDLGEGDTGSTLLNYINRNRHIEAYLINDHEYQEFCSVVEKHGSALPDHIRYDGETEWAREIRLKKSNILDALSARKDVKIKDRPNQSQFRRKLMDIYNSRCLVTACSVPQALEAAHVLPHDGSSIRDRSDNGLLIRRDFHAMFDAMLWTINPNTGTVVLSQAAKDGGYSAFDGMKVSHNVAKEPLLFHFTQFHKQKRNQP